MSNDQKPVAVPGDNPIRNPEDDVLDRLETARSFARHVLELDVSQGTVVGVLGPWGSGKTSFINLVRKEFERKDVPILEFNPWMFSGTEELVQHFFGQLSAKLKLRNLAKVGKAIKAYGKEISGKVGIVMKIAGMLLGSRGGIDCRRKTVEEALMKRKKPIVVVLDDVDRLSAQEIRDIFKLVRLTCSFPNLIYIVACDRLRVEQALEEQGQTGRDYLEKILQLPFDLPEISHHILQRQLFDAIEDSLTDIKTPGPFDREVWSDVYREIIRPLIRNMRDVRRYVAAIRGTVSGFDGNVAHADILGLEAVRMFLPDVFRCLPGAIDSLTATSGPQSFERDFATQTQEQVDNSHDHTVPRRERLIKELSKAAGQQPEVVQAMLGLLFPEDAVDRKEELLRERRVAHEHVLSFYLERVVSDDLLSFYDAERAFARMADRNDLDEFMRSLDPARWQDVVSNLNGFEFSPKHVEPGIIVFLNLLPNMPERSQDVFDTLNPPELTIRRVVRTLLQAHENDPASVESVTRRILTAVTALSSKLELVSVVGNRPESGMKLVSETAANQIEKMLRTAIQSAPVNDLVLEHNLGLLLQFAKDGTDPSEETFNIDASPKLTLALLKSVSTGIIQHREIYPRQRTFTATVASSGSLNSLAANRSIRLEWEFLIGLYGDEITFKARIASLNAQFDDLKPWIKIQGIPLDGAAYLLELANNYLNR